MIRHQPVFLVPWAMCVLARFGVFRVGSVGSREGNFFRELLLHDFGGRARDGRALCAKRDKSFKPLKPRLLRGV
eukprot:m.287168 g.287168  ORF g.287168 m.287168 type:complete len:74 (-) comp19442_c3_seq8:1780-2001(-)